MIGVFSSESVDELSASISWIVVSMALPLLFSMPLFVLGVSWFSSPPSLDWQSGWFGCLYGVDTMVAGCV